MSPEWLEGEARAHVRHPEALQLHRVDEPLDGHVVAHRDAVPALLGSPAMHPFPPTRRRDRR